jgi:NADH-quinone oxidoreductase subunit F
MSAIYQEGKEPHPKERRIVFKNVDREGWDTSLAMYETEEGYDQLKKAVGMEPGAITDEVKKAGLRGRGGAGFPAGVKWGFLPPNNDKPVYLICNAGRVRARHLQRPLHHSSGSAPADRGNGDRLLRGRSESRLHIHSGRVSPKALKPWKKAIEEAHEKGYLGKNILGSGFDLEIYVHRGAGAYICGEETGLIESLEGKRPYPRIKPPYFPAAMGLYLCPTIVNNVETLCHVKHILEVGGEEWSKIGTPNNTGTRILCVSGDVKKPGYYEVEVGTVTMGELINDMCGGLKEGRSLKAVIPGGSSAKVLRADEVFTVGRGDDARKLTIWDIPMDFDTLAACGSMAGSGGVIVIDDSRSISWVLNNINNFYAHESCGQCTPCREGSLWMKKITDRVVAGKASPSDIDTLDNVARNIDGRTICAFGEACSWPTESFIDKFRDELVSDTNPELEGELLNAEAVTAAANLG